MATLEKVTALRNQGLSEGQIIDSLRQQGVPPTEINEALSQSKIKSEVMQPQMQPSLGQQPQQSQYPEYAPPAGQQPPGGQMQPSIAQQPPTMQPPEPTPEGQIPEPVITQPQTIPPPEPAPTPSVFPETQVSDTFQPNQYAAYGDTEQYPPEGGGAQELQEYYPSYEQYPPYEAQQAFDIETINDIAEQIVEEKLIVIKDQMRSMNRLGDELANEMQRLIKRIEKIENSFDELQSSVLRKVGTYGEDIKNISKELSMTQKTFSKIVDPLTDNIRKLREIAGEKPKSKETPKTKESSKPVKKEKSSRTPRNASSFEDYLR